MPKLIVIVALLLSLACKRAEGNGSSFDRAAEAVYRAEFKKAAELYADAAKTDDDPVRRAKAAIRLANIEWRVFEQHDAARTRLQRVAAGEHEAFAARLELTRAALDRKDGRLARAEAREAMKSAKTRLERRRAAMALAHVVLETPHEPQEIRAAIDSLHAVIAEAGPATDPARMLLKAALIAGEGAIAMEAIDGYYHVSQFSAPPNRIAAAHAALARVLPTWRGTDAERPAIVEGLGGMRFFAEAALVSRGAPTDVVAYARTIERVDDLIDDYYRDLANDRADHGDFEETIERELKPYGTRFGTYMILGETGGFQDCHFAHVVGDRTLAVEQYGRKGTLRFVELDSVVSNGFGSFLSDGSSNDGGWATEKEIYQVRPAYADTPLRAWLLMTDAEHRAEYDKETAAETARDRQRAKTRPIGEFPGLSKRLNLQYLASAYAAAPARDAFLARIEKETFQSSIVLHEGRHAIDKLSKQRFKTWELEYRAKLSEIALADAPRGALQNVVDNTIGGDSPHGKANEHLMKGVVAWMEQHRSEIAGLDASLPLMPQLDRLTDAQIWAAVGALDPLAR